ncbi:hypothetical protein JG687_00015416 [Phytophthora cactorum]|uniref:cystathionine gamma-lyase n=1 Tax=Phytophthora cactorum TaxID=29920 RepID=A0A8T1TX02_9STRA|nr:hypothetical protein JG687_00015416 [Phytophthora cactorum]
MMSSVDMSNSNRSSHPSSQQFPGSDSRYNGQNMRYAAPPPRSSTGRAKTEQVVLEFLYKAAELIVQSRVNFHAEPDLRRSNRRARFNLDIEEVQVVRDSMAPWKEDVRLPLAIDIFWDTGSHKVLLERWSVTFAADGESSSAHLGSTQDVIQQLKEVCKRISVLLRALFSFMRQLPAHRLFTQSYPSMLSYTMHTAPASDATRAFEAQRVATSGYSFVPIMTPFGLLKVTAIYRRDCDQFTEQQEQAAPSRILPDNFIIQDYVPGSPELTPASAPVTSAAMTSSPLRVTDLRTGSFVPVSDTEQFDVGTLQRRRSSPRSIPAAHQQFSNTGLVGDNVGDDDGVVQSQPGMSKPMAIPRVSSKGGIATAAGREVGAVLQQAHSYGGEHDARLRGAAANPNVAAAPYGYGNVAIDRDQERSSSPSLAFQQRQQQLWEGHADRHDTEIGFHSSTTSFDEQPASNSTQVTSIHPFSMSSAASKYVDEHHGFGTTAIHEGQAPDEHTGAVAVPITLASTFAQASPGVVAGRNQANSFGKGWEYSRTGNPTRGALERALAACEKGRFAVCFSSGMAATTAVTHLLKHGDHVLCIDDVYGGTQRYFRQTNPLTLGADIVVHSITKYINGHSDVVGGVVITNSEDINTKLRFVQNGIGAIPAPFDCYMALRGLKTLHVRMATHAKNAQAVAEYLEAHPAVEKVCYPGLKSHPQHEIAKKQASGFGGMVTFYVHGGLEKARAFLENLEVFTLAESLGAVESLAESPAIMTHASVPPEVRKEIGISDSLIRLSVGIEGLPDIIADLERALAAEPKSS